MYEPEVNNSIESIDTLPFDIRRRFAEYRHRIASRTVLPWGEHCTECVWPTCYTTCDLYSPRPDGACRQFVDGMVRIDHNDGLSPYLLKLRFKRWAKLWTVGALRLQPLSLAARKELIHITVGAIGRNAPLPAPLKPRLLRKIGYLRRRSAETGRSAQEIPDYFLLECYNPNGREINITFTVRAAHTAAPPFQKMIGLLPGYTRAAVAVADIFRSVDITQPFTVEIVPGNCDDTVLYFGLMDFVKERRGANVETASRPHAGPPARKSTLKCIVWDLDNTLWSGVLVEDGAEKIRIRQGVLDLIKEADRRGILHSIASKNNFDAAMEVLRTYRIDEYFLFPQIKWQPKSESLAHIAQVLNIGLDTLALVDDQAFEREEVTAALPQVTVIDAADYGAISDRPEWRVPVTAESANRRSMYREQEQRQTALTGHTGDYKSFLKGCRIEITVKRLDETNLRRVYELAQRTNQLNFSGNRYQEGDLIELPKARDIETCVIDCTDRFGAYGIVGFAVVDTKKPHLLDLMFSCRVQGKRVEHAVLAFLLKRFVASDRRDFYATYRKTAKNAAAGSVFEEMGFETAADTGDPAALVFRHGREIPDDAVIKISSHLS